MSCSGSGGVLREDLPGMGQRGNRRQRIVQLVRDHADHLLPGRDFLRIDLARELLEQQQAMRHRVQQEAALRDVVDLGFAADLEREQRVAAAIDGFAQWRGRALQVTREPLAFELAALGEQPARAGVAVQHGVGIVGQHQRQRRGLDDGVEHQLALVQALSFDAQPVAETVVVGDQFAELIARSCRVTLMLKSRSLRLRTPSLSARAMRLQCDVRRAPLQATSGASSSATSRPASHGIGIQARARSVSEHGERCDAAEPERGPAGH